MCKVIVDTVDSFLNKPTASAACPLARAKRWATQCTWTRYGEHFSRSCTPTPDFLPVITGAPSVAKPTINLRLIPLFPKT